MSKANIQRAQIHSTSVQWLNDWTAQEGLQSLQTHMAVMHHFREPWEQIQRSLDHTDHGQRGEGDGWGERLSIIQRVRGERGQHDHERESIGDGTDAHVEEDVVQTVAKLSGSDLGHLVSDSIFPGKQFDASDGLQSLGGIARTPHGMEDFAGCIPTSLMMLSRWSDTFCCLEYSSDMRLVKKELRGMAKSITAIATSVL